MASISGMRSIAVLARSHSTALEAAADNVGLTKIFLDLDIGQNGVVYNDTVNVGKLVVDIENKSTSKNLGW